MVRPAGSSRPHSSARETFQEALEAREYSDSGSAEEPGILQRHGQGVSNPCEGSKILFFLFQPRPMCYSLLHLRSS
jgi:hypothetical protein